MTHICWIGKYIFALLVLIWVEVGILQMPRWSSEWQASKIAEEFFCVQNCDFLWTYLLYLSTFLNAKIDVTTHFNRMNMFPCWRVFCTVHLLLCVAHVCVYVCVCVCVCLCHAVGTWTCLHSHTVGTHFSYGDKIQVPITQTIAF